MDYIVRSMLGPYNFASFSRPYHEGTLVDALSPAADRLFQRSDCTDGKFAGIHRDAAPVLLPYISRFGAEP